MGTAKDVIAIVSGIIGIVALVKTMDWWKGLQEFQLAMAGVFVYLVWWTFDRYHRSNLKAIEGAKTDTNKAVAEVTKSITGLTTRYDNHVKEQLRQRNADQTEFYKKLGELVTRESFDERLRVIEQKLQIFPGDKRGIKE